MKSLQTLIDLKQQELDEQRRILVQLEEEMERLKAQEAELKKELAREGDIASKQPDMARYFGAFAQGNEQQQEQTREKQATINTLVEKQRDVITEAFAELKKMEIVKEKRETEEQANADRKETEELDEIGLRKFTEGG